jgi:AcrR family transcriptional regulator
VNRPSNRLDAALLASGRELFPTTGCAGLSLRVLAEHAGVNAGMFHYHFKSKDNFLRTLLQQLYEEMYAGLQLDAGHDGPAFDRLGAALTTLARFARDHRRVLARIWMDVLAGEAVALEFVRDNAPRHLGLLVDLVERSRAEGALRELPPVQRLVFLLGALVLPMVFAAGLVDAGVAPVRLRRDFDAQVMSDAAIAQRVDLALAALRGPARQQQGEPAQAAPRRRARVGGAR